MADRAVLETCLHSYTSGVAHKKRRLQREQQREAEESKREETRLAEAEAREVGVQR
jgi:hypothetical protein